MMRRMCLIFFQVESPAGCCLYQAKVRKESFYAFLPITDARGRTDMQGTWLLDLK